MKIEEVWEIVVSATYCGSSYRKRLKAISESPIRTRNQTSYFRFRERLVHHRLRLPKDVNVLESRTNRRALLVTPNLASVACLSYIGVAP